MSLAPPPRTRVDVVVAGDDDVVVYWRSRGANDSEFQGESPSGAAVTVTGINSYHIVCGQKVEGWSDVDSSQLLPWRGLVLGIFPGPVTPAS